MIITEINAENFRKYTHLQLENIPPRGLIGLLGGNESGKSSIGEAIQFGLYGRTDQLETSDAAKLIHWGTDKATVSLRLSHRGHEYRLVRSVDQQGNTAATLFSTEEGITLAGTPESVERQLRAMLGYNYTAFSKAFYWGQRSSRKQEGDSDVLRSIAGLKEHSRLSEQLGKESAEQQLLINDLDRKREHTFRNLQDITTEQENLPRLEHIDTVLENRQQHLKQLGQRLEKGSIDYPDNLNNFRQVRKRSHKIGFWTKISLLIFLLTLLIGAFLMFNPEWGRSLLAGLADNTRDMAGRAFIRIASVAALISAALLIYGWYVDMRHLRPLLKQSKNLHAAINESYEACTQPVNRQLPNEAIDYLVEKHLVFPDVSTDHADMGAIPDWSQSSLNYDTKPLYIHSAADTLNEGLNNRNKELGDYRDLVQAEIDHENQQIEYRKTLQAMLDEQDDELEAKRRHQVVLSTAMDLLQRDARDSIGRFNRLVKTRCPELLQSFTQGHYKSLEIKPDLSLQVLSEEKGDFLDFNEISTGTQRQISLAMQLALANALADATKAETQFLFLDEPFAFFDLERTATTLQSLETNSAGAVSQVWLATQNQPDGVKFSHTINCVQGESVLQDRKT